MEAWALWEFFLDIILGLYYICSYWFHGRCERKQETWKVSSRLWVKFYKFWRVRSSNKILDWQRGAGLLNRLIIRIVYYKKKAMKCLLFAHLYKKWKWKKKKERKKTTFPVDQFSFRLKSAFFICPRIEATVKDNC